jgi:hypothetical protein
MRNRFCPLICPRTGAATWVRPCGRDGTGHVFAVAKVEGRDREAVADREQAPVGTHEANALHVVGLVGEAREILGDLGRSDLLRAHGPQPLVDAAQELLVVLEHLEGVLGHEADGALRPLLGSGLELVPVLPGREAQDHGRDKHRGDEEGQEIARHALEVGGDSLRVPDGVGGLRAAQERGHEPEQEDHERDARHPQGEVALREGGMAGGFVDGRVGREHRRLHGGVVHARHREAHDARREHPLPGAGLARREPQGHRRSPDRDQDGESGEKAVVA